MQNAMATTLPTPTILIGSDCPLLSPRRMHAAADALNDGFDAVFLPAEDGGYVLIGLSADASPVLFEKIPWGTADVMAITRSRLKELGYSWTEPARLWDVDRPVDLLRWEASTQTR
jgi:glycosyltransferase A (GT-A) superfamily protein (DUF2064 family)